MTTQAERIQKLTETRAKLEENASAYNEAIRTDGTTAEVIAELNSKKDELLGIYVATAREMCYEECKAAEDPMLHAAQKYNFDCISVKDVQDKDTGTVTRTIVDTKKVIDLFTLHRHCKGIGKNSNWVYMLERFNYLLTYKTVTDITTGDDQKAKLDKLKKTYAMDKVSKDIDMGKTPTSNTQVLKQLDTLIAATIGEEYHGLSIDAKFLLKIYTKEGKGALSVVTPTHSRFCGKFLRVLHRIVTNGTYEAEYKEEK